jgi:hypothetical protein
MGEQITEMLRGVLEGTVYVSIARAKEETPR